MAWSAAAQAARRMVDVLVKVDVGFHRCGVDPGDPEVPAFIAQVGAAPGLRLKGLLSHAGHAYLAQSDDALALIATEEARLLRATADAVRARGASIAELSVGSTPTARFVGDTAGLTEMRPGNYVYYDRSQVALGSARVEDCALTVLSTVVSKHPDRLILDAGSKTLTSDQIARPGHPGFGGIFTNLALANALHPQLLIERLSEEHATVRVTGDTDLQVGDRVRILPNHACVVSNLVDDVVLVAGTHVIDRMPVAARGKST
jgi:D-serine deaminase-like pyridoxal phosphate-dependent protein